jgi:predicted DNA-binding transcriptional regulator AlpA
MASEDDDDSEGKWARARAIAAEDEALKAEHAEFRRLQSLSSRFRNAGSADVLQMFETGTNEKGQPLTQFEFEALCERWCEVFGELPPTGEPSEPTAEPDPLPADEEMIPMKRVVGITGVSKSTIKRWVNDPANDFPRPVKVPASRRINWRADQVKAWRRKIEATGSDR